MSDYAASNTDRILANTIRYGRVVSVKDGLATVDFDGEIIEGLQWAKARAGDDRQYSAPSENEQVCVFSPSGDLTQGVIGFSISQDDFPDAGDDGNPRTIYSDGTIVEYNKETHTLLIDASKSSGNVIVKCTNAKIDSDEVEFTGDVKIGGALEVDGESELKSSLKVSGETEISNNLDVKGSSIKHLGIEVGVLHKHGGVQGGTGTSGTVVP
ncbi:phage baseplate assembly protein V [Acinetobacter sp. YH01020]|uniref:phage baseplate assembly protein V n=1 Tax=Acinetobacter sp. YH01020 TaxID=2601034 RepID=UPI0015D438E2|nr:phage baseplate assembly protein V [Acinetobacter sp. YH01020]